MSASSEQEAVVAQAPIGWPRVAVRRDGERALLRAAKRGSADAVEALVRRHWDGAHRAAYLIVQDAGAAEDIAQEAMLAAVGAIHGFDRRRPFRPWLHRIVANRSVDWLRARGRRAEVSAEALDELEHRGAAAGTRLSEELAAALAALDPQDRAIVVLRHLLDYRSGEIARIVDLPPATVRTRLRRALERVREHLDNDEGGSPWPPTA